MMKSNSQVTTRTSGIAEAEGGWGWVVAGGTFLVTMVLSIPGIVFGILLSDILVAFDTTTATASWTMSISLGLSSLISPLVSMAIQRFSCRIVAFAGGLLLSSGMILSYFVSSISMLFVTYGLLTGVGYGCNRIATAVVLGQYFHERYGMATGIMMSGFSASRLSFATSFQWIRQTYGFRNTFLLTGAVCLNCCVGAALFWPLRHATEQQKPECQPLKPLPAATNGDKAHQTENLLDDPDDGGQKRPMKYLDLSLMKDNTFYAIIGSSIPFQVVFIYSTVFLMPLGQDKGFQSMETAVLMSIKAIGELAGRLGIPWILLHLKVDATLAYVSMCVLNGLAFIVHALVDGYIPFAASAVVTSFFCGGIAIQGYHLTLACVGPDKLSSALGLCALFTGVFVLLAGPVLGFVRDTLGSLSYSFLVLAALQLVSGMAWTFWLLESSTGKKFTCKPHTSV